MCFVMAGKPSTQILLLAVALFSYESLVNGQTTRCVPKGTCINTGTTTPPTPTPGIDPRTEAASIDPRIVVPSTAAPPPTTASTPPPTAPPATTAPPPPTSCPADQMLCPVTPTATQCGQRYVTNISTANGVATPGAYPWQTFMMAQNAYIGSGVLVDSLYVVTAAHKVEKYKAASGNITVYIGVWDPKDLTKSQKQTVATITIHEKFDPKTLKNDIAVLKLSGPIYLGFQNNIATACLPAVNTSYTSQRCMVAGWGKVSFNATDGATPYKQVTVPIVDFNTCRTSMMKPDVLGAATDTYLDANGELCAGGEANVDACTHDGGAPLACNSNGKWYVAGLVIWGKGCGRAGVYGVYVDMGKYKTWIDSKIPPPASG